jgi:hypothetical protein
MRWCVERPNGEDGLLHDCARYFILSGMPVPARTGLANQSELTFTGCPLVAAAQNSSMAAFISAMIGSMFG